MFELPGRLIGDAWFYIAGDVAHCFFLTCDAGLQRHEHWDIGHAVSDDLRAWRDVGLALRGADGAWDHNLATGSVLRRDGRYWMAYTGHSAAQVGLAMSDDLERWERVGEGPITSVDERWYERVGSGERAMTHWRDPQLFEADGWVYQAVTASGWVGPADGRGVVGLARSRDMAVWEVVAPLETPAVVQELECPQVVEGAGGRWYLVFSTHGRLWSAAHRRAHPEAAGVGGTYAMVGGPLGPFELRQPGPIMPAGAASRPYAAQLVRWRGAAYVLGTVGGSAGHGAVSDPIRVRMGDAGIAAV
jgi:beta-fructofuranosidase